MFDLCGAGTRGTITKCFRSLHSQAMVEVTRPSTPPYSRTALSPGKMCVTYTRSERACRERCSTTCFEFLIFDIERRPQLFSPLRRHPSFPDRFPLRFGTATAQWRLMASLARDTRAIDIEMDINRGGVKTRAFFHLVAWQVSRETQVLERIPSFLRTTLFEVFLFEKNPSRV